MNTETLLFSLPVGDDLLRGSFNDVGENAGIVFVPRASADAVDAAFIDAFNGAGLSTFSVGLLTAREEGFSDIRDNVPLLAKRLLDFIDHLKRLLARDLRRRMAIYAEGAASPVALRAASERDNEVAALVCRGGLIDRAGSLYLDALDSRLLFIADTDDTACLASAERAFGRIRCEKETARIDADDTVARKAIEWFQSVRDQGSGIR